MMKEFKNVESLECDRKGLCKIRYDGLETEIETEGLLLEETEKTSFNGGVDIKLEGKTCRLYGKVLVCKKEFPE